MKKILVWIGALFLWTGTVISAQNIQKCGYDQLKHQILAENPHLRGKLESYESQIKEWAGKYGNSLAETQLKNTDVVTIPVVFHVILTQQQLNQLGGESGILSRAISQIEALNDDFNALNADLANTPAAFQPVIGNAGIRFGLAHRKPNGLSTDGYEILITNKGGFDIDQGSAGSGFGGSDAKYTISGGLNSWDPSKYLNVWIINPIQSGSALTLGMALPPSYVNSFGIPASEKGIILHYGVFGKRSGPGSQYYLSGNDKGRTLTHEVGHMLSLRHIWGDNDGCPPATPDDDIADTPPQASANHGCPVFPSVSCNNGPSGDMFMNYMDYVNDACMYMFTRDQVDRMNLMLTLPQESLGLTQHPELLEWPTSVTETGYNSEVHFYPNPAEKEIYITMTNTLGLRDIRLMNMFGQQLDKIDNIIPQVNEYSFDVSGYPSGIYFVKCTFDNGTMIRKIIVQ